MARSGSTFDAESPGALPPSAARILERVRKLAWLLDRAIPVGSKARIGLDPLLGLIPGIGDWIGSALSLYILLQALRLRVPARVVAAMVFNVIAEAALGTVPVLGDLFDFAWQANTRNARLLESHRTSAEPRPLGVLALGLIAAVFTLLLALGVVAFLVARWLWQSFA